MSQAMRDGEMYQDQNVNDMYTDNQDHSIYVDPNDDDINIEINNYQMNNNHNNMMDMEDTSVMLNSQQSGFHMDQSAFKTEINDASPKINFYDNSLQYDNEHLRNNDPSLQQDLEPADDFDNLTESMKLRNSKSAVDQELIGPYLDQLKDKSSNNANNTGEKKGNNHVSLGLTDNPHVQEVDIEEVDNNNNTNLEGTYVTNNTNANNTMRKNSLVDTWSHVDTTSQYTAYMEKKKSVMRTKPDTQLRKERLEKRKQGQKSFIFEDNDMSQSRRRYANTQLGDPYENTSVSHSTRIVNHENAAYLQSQEFYNDGGKTEMEFDMQSQKGSKYERSKNRPAGVVSQSHANLDGLSLDKNQSSNRQQDYAGKSIIQINLANVDGYFEKIQSLNKGNKNNTPDDQKSTRTYSQPNVQGYNFSPQQMKDDSVTLDFDNNNGNLDENTIT